MKVRTSVKKIAKIVVLLNVKVLCVLFAKKIQDINNVKDNRFEYVKEDI